MNTPNVNTKKRELSSPEFDIESKKNKHVSSSSESDLDISDTLDSLVKDSVTVSTALEPVTESTDMASSAVTAGLSSEATETVTTGSTQHFTIPPSEMLKLSEMLKGTFRGEIEGLVDSVVNGVLKGLNERISSLEKENTDLKNLNKSLTSRKGSRPGRAIQ